MASAARCAVPRLERAGSLLSFVIILGACMAGLAVAAQQGARTFSDLVVSSTLERIGTAPHAPADAGAVTATDTPAPAEEQLIVNVRFTNSSEQVLDSLRITSPIPPELSYVAQSASGPGTDVLFSVDDGRSFGRPDELTMATPDGVRGADPSDYTHIRWVLRAPLDAGALGVVRFRAVPR